MFLPIVKGYGTILFQIVTLYGWHSAQALTSPGFVRNHREFGWSFAAFASTPTFFIWLICRNRWLNVGRLVISIWCAFYIASLFFLFRATDGP
jgi:hypothetical protein